MRESKLPTQGYREKILERTGNPRSTGSLDGDNLRVGTGTAGTPESGDMVRSQVKVNERQINEDVRFKAFGCGSSIASSSLMTEWVKGKTMEGALRIRNPNRVEELAVPPAMVHCSVPAEDALRTTIQNYWDKRETAAPRGSAATPLE